jgi:S-adenosylmethionine:diacylglycerol 3-amino-3-carboxypropyl transferase
LLYFFFCGRYAPNGVLPAHLQERHYRALRQGVERVRIVTESLPDYVERCERQSIAKYSLSNFASYTNEEEYKRTW